MYLDQVDVEAISSGTTALDQALKHAIRAFKDLPQRKNKLLLILTDGEDFSSNLNEYKQAAQQEKLHIFAIGIGTPEGAPIPLFDAQGNPAGHQKDAKGTIVITRLNEGILKNLAQDVGGIYLHGQESDQELSQLVRKIQSYEKEHLEDKTYARLEDKYNYFLLGSFICFLLEWVL
jgi:Ca-activated chloride channel family protein